MSVTELKRARWGGIFQRAEETTEPPADVATMPRDLNKLVERIKSTRERLAEVDAERETILDEWRRAEQEKDDVLAQNQSKRAQVQMHLTKLQGQFAEIGADCGVEVTVRPSNEPR